MQKCKKCGASWSSSEKLVQCPYCGNNLDKLKYIDNITDAFDVIIKRHGNDVFMNGSLLLGLLGDYAPGLTHERNLVKVAIESGAYEHIYKCPASQKELVANKYIILLHNSYYIDAYWAKSVISWYLEALGYKNLNLIDVKTKNQNTISKEKSDDMADSHNTFVKFDEYSSIKDTKRARNVKHQNGKCIQRNSGTSIKRNEYSNDQDQQSELCQYLNDPQFVRFVSGMIHADNTVIEAIDQNGNLLTNNVHTQTNSLKNLIYAGTDYINANGLRLDMKGNCVSLGSNHLYGIVSNEIYPGLRFDGRVVPQNRKRFNPRTETTEIQYVFSILPYIEEMCIRNLSTWRDIVMIRSSSTGYGNVLFGLRKDGTIISVGCNPIFREIEMWRDIVYIDVRECVFIGITKKGTVQTCIDESACYGSDSERKRIHLKYHMRIMDQTKDWNNIVSAIIGSTNIIALKKNGTLITAGDSEFRVAQQTTYGTASSLWQNPCDVHSFHNIIGIFRHNRIKNREGIYSSGVIGLSSNGRVIRIDSASDFANDIVRDCSSWILFSDPFRYYNNYKKRILDCSESRLKFDELAFELCEIITKLESRSGFSGLLNMGARRKMEARRREIEAYFRAI